MAFDGTEGELIPLADGAVMTAAFRKNNANGNAVFYGKDILNELLAQPGCMGIRFHFALDGDGNNTLVLTAAGADENDMLVKVADKGMKCPLICGGRNALNS